MTRIKWMNSNTLNDLIKNKNKQCKLGVVKIEDEIRENRLRWFDHVPMRSADITKNIDCLEVAGFPRGSGRPKT